MPFLVAVVALFIVLALVITISNNRFNQMVNAEIEAMFGALGSQSTKTFSVSDLEGLPEPVQKFLARSLKEGQPYVDSVRLRQSGTMRLSPDQPWKPFEAEQYFTTNPPAFIWLAKTNFLPLIWVVARDKYGQQQGNMLVKILATLTIVNATGPQLASAAFIRFLAELMWFPISVLKQDYIQWEAVDATCARAVARDKDVKAGLTYYFDKTGDLTKVVSENRYKNADDPHPTPWCGYFKQYKELNGVRLPSEVEAGWELETGYFAYWRGSITHIEFNVPTRY